MVRKSNLLIVFGSSILLTALFHRHYWGLNVLLFDCGLLVYLLITSQLKLKGFIPLVITMSFFLTSLAVVFTSSALAVLVHIITFMALTGLHVYPDVRSIASSLGLAITHLFTAQSQFIGGLAKLDLNGFRVGVFFRKLLVFVIPVLIILVFVLIYRQANPVFDDFAFRIFDSISVFFSKLFRGFDALLIVTFVISLFISNFLVLRSDALGIGKIDLFASELLIRKRPVKPYNFKKTGLRSEIRAGVFLFFVLNAILLIVNVIDINWVWLNFEWDGNYLKQFVHEGTYLLIISILISIALVLFFFRGNLNFYSRNKLIRYLSYIWLAQNVILAISVAVRNVWYIEYYALAYKRIGVFVFLILTLFGLLSVLYKVHRGKSIFWLFKFNSLIAFIVLVLFSTFNWDGIIANYNVKHAGKSFLHLDFISTLSDKVLPVIDLNSAYLKEIIGRQENRYPSNMRYMSPDQYVNIISNRKQVFIKRWETSDWLEWNLPDYLAYKKLKDKP